ncbi:LOW QUALITY PROTEIN: toll-like receptor 3 [Strongylocentrotus purpuratus]|uniref:TIR domain-containing protein n=1 Tax=Strongylocentrotus purpuratus TaxID=7668 RepID=A0A7M7NSE0_STRPU|nr:LOW QUALITY PROTEIN: toll-like receptor 3 [Strongylocentrotus purpuratus]
MTQENENFILKKESISQAVTFENMKFALMYFVVFLSLGVVLLPQNTDGSPTSGTKPLPKECNIVNDTFVDCRHKDLRTIPTGFPATVETLLLSYNSIRVITNESFHGLVNLVTLELHHNSISKLRSVFFKDQEKLRYLSLHHNQIGKLPNDVFEHVQDLEVLDLSYMNNGFTSLPVALTGLLNLRVLDFSSNRLQSAGFTPDATFPALQELHLGKNQIKSLQNADFKALLDCKLSFLDMTENQVVDIESGVFHPIASVAELDFSKGLDPVAIPALSEAISDQLVHTLYLKEIDLGTQDIDKFKDLRNSTLEKLDISFNNITSLNSEFWGLSNVTSLIIQSSLVTTIGATAFSGLHLVETVDLSSNQIATKTLYLNYNKINNISASDGFRGLSKLLYLKLSNNKIKQNFVGEEFKGLDSLEVLDLGVNTNILLSPDAFRFLQSLQTLYLNLANIKNITVVPSPFDKLSGLKNLDLSNNNMSALHVDTFSSLDLGTMYLQHNNLYNMWNETIHVPFLKSLRRLKYLNLCYNGFQNIPNNSLSNLPELKALFLCHNKISHLQDNIINDLPLTTLDLGHNQINLINQTLLEPLLGTLKALTVSGNPFSCGCDLQWFREWLDVTQVHVDDNSHMICSSPPDMRGKLVIDFHPETLNCDHRLPLYTWVLVGVGSCMVFVTVALAVKFRFHINYCFNLVNARRRKYQRIKGEDLPFLYDAFVFFSHKDEEWVYNELVRHLEDDSGLRLCVHNRDFTLGRKILDNTIEAVDSSRFTLCILSADYLDSHWCKMEQEFAMANLIDRDVLIIIALGEIPENKITKYYKLHKVMMKRTYLKWPMEPGVQRNDFWMKLKTVLREPELRINNNVSI